MAWKDKQTSKNNSFIQSFRHALAGLRVALTEERNLRYHLMIALAVIILGVTFQLDSKEWLLLIVVIGLVIILELLNTVIENLVDLVTNGSYHPLAKKVKDLAAGIVLVASVLAVIIGLLLFIPKIMS